MNEESREVLASWKKSMSGVPLSEPLEKMLKDIDPFIFSIAGEPKTLAFMLYLAKKGECSLDQMSEDLSIDSKILKEGLVKPLNQAALVINYYVKKEGTENYSWYKLSESGFGLLNSVLGWFFPKPDESSGIE